MGKKQEVSIHPKSNSVIGRAVHPLHLSQFDVDGVTYNSIKRFVHHMHIPDYPLDLLKCKKIRKRDAVRTPKTRVTVREPWVELTRCIVTKLLNDDYFMHYVTNVDYTFVMGTSNPTPEVMGRVRINYSLYSPVTYIMLVTDICSVIKSWYSRCGKTQYLETDSNVTYSDFYNMLTQEERWSLNKYNLFNTGTSR